MGCSNAMQPRLCHSLVLYNAVAATRCCLAIVVEMHKSFINAAILHRAQYIFNSTRVRRNQSCYLYKSR